MNAVTLLYHDVTAAECEADSGFQSADANIYKLSTADFEEHLKAIAATRNVPRHTVCDLLDGRVREEDTPVFLSFDDGGASALSTADLLDRRGWKGHFFVTTDFIGRRGFVGEKDIRELHARGHLIGSHSCSHPCRFSHLSDRELGEEWTQSIHKLEDILGQGITTASVPGGFYSRRVAEFASKAGIQALFNSEPAVRCSCVEGCVVIGRFGLRRSSPAELAAKFAGRDAATLRWEAAFWNAKKLIKSAGGEQWLTFRRWWLAR